MDNQTKMERMTELRAKLENAANLYYGTGTSPLTDKEFDDAFEELKLLENEFGVEDKFTDRVGAASTGSDEIRHEFPALSLGKSKQISDIIKAQMTHPDGENSKATVSWKLDGMTLQLTYENGTLKTAATRGNGTVGKNVLGLAPFIEGIPKAIDYVGKLVVRGEAVMSYAEFAHINEQINDNGERFANPRNLVAGTLGSDNSEDIRNRHINFKAFKLVHIDGYSEPSFAAQLDWLAEIGFGVVEHELTKVSDLADTLERWSVSEKAVQMGFPVDGLVIVCDDVKFGDSLTGTDHHPNLCTGMALKWKDETYPTTITDIEWSASRTGLLNPVAVFKPVIINGASITRASVHNISYLIGKDLRKGCGCSIYLANQIIPQIDENSDFEKPDFSDYGRYGIPEKCPVCGNRTAVEKSGVSDTLVLKCINPDCAAKQIGRFVRFADKDGLDIAGLSEATITDFVNMDIIKSLPDFFRLGAHHDEIVTLEGYGETSFRNLVEAIEKSRKKATFATYLYANSIPNIGRGQAKLLKKAIEDYHNSPEHKPEGAEDYIQCLARMVWEGYDFSTIEGFGDVLTSSLVNWVTLNLVDVWFRHTPDTEATELYSMLTFTDEWADNSTTTEGSKVAGLTFVVTGDVFKFKNRAELQAKIESLGGKVAGSVSKNTHALINNDVNSTSGKNQKAKSLGIPIISEDDFIVTYLN